MSLYRTDGIRAISNSKILAEKAPQKVGITQLTCAPHRLTLLFLSSLLSTKTISAGGTHSDLRRQPRSARIIKAFFPWRFVHFFPDIPASIYVRLIRRSATQAFVRFDRALDRSAEERERREGEMQFNSNKNTRLS